MSTQTVTDAVGRLVKSPRAPQRIVSLCPSQTELVVDLVGAERVVGRTQWCIHPEPAIQQITTVGGTKKVNARKVARLEPDFILCEKEENTPEMVAELETIAPVYVTDVQSVADGVAMIRRVGELLAAPAAESLAREIEQSLQALRTAISPLPVYRTAYLIWRQPWMAAGSPTYIHSMLTLLNLNNVFAGRSSRYPDFDLQELQTARPELVLLSSEPYAFGPQHKQEIRQALPAARVELVEGEWFSWYGSRMRQALPALHQWRWQLNGWDCRNGC